MRVAAGGCNVPISGRAERQGTRRGDSAKLSSARGRPREDAARQIDAHSAGEGEHLPTAGTQVDRRRVHGAQRRGRDLFPGFGPTREKVWRAVRSGPQAGVYDKLIGVKETE